MTIKINQQPDAAIFQFIILTFIYSSTCFGRFPPIIRSYNRPDHEHSTTITTIRR